MINFFFYKINWIHMISFFFIMELTSCILSHRWTLPVPLPTRLSDHITVLCVRLGFAGFMISVSFIKVLHKPCSLFLAVTLLTPVPQSLTHFLLCSLNDSFSAKSINDIWLDVWNDDLISTVYTMYNSKCKKSPSSYRDINVCYWSVDARKPRRILGLSLTGSLLSVLSLYRPPFLVNTILESLTCK